MKKPKVGKRIPISLRGSADDSCKSELISGKKTYMVKVDGGWYVGKFSKQWYGWNFEGGPYDAGVELDSVQLVYEMEL